MTVSDNSLGGSYSPDGLVKTLESFSPNAGELWFVGDVYAFCDGTGSNVSEITTNFGLEFGNGPSLSGNDVGDISRGGEGIGTSGDTTEGKNRRIGKYFTSSDTFTIETDGQSDSCTISYVAELRRIL